MNETNPIDKVILDACCGSRMFWFNKTNSNTIFVDVRNETHILCDGRKLTIAPDIQADFRQLPFANDQFKMVVFDPPHLKSAGPNGWQAKKYGSLDKDWRVYLKQGMDECFRVLDVYGTLIFKWNEHSIKVSEVLRAIERQPLIGHRTMQNNKTIWMVFMKLPTPKPEEP